MTIDLTFCHQTKSQKKLRTYFQPRLDIERIVEMILPNP